MKKIAILSLLLPGVLLFSQAQEKLRAREHGITIGVLPVGIHNAITDVEGVRVGHTTIKNENILTGVTAIIPHGENIFQQKVPAAIFVGNGFGKLAGTTQLMELGNLETPIVLTNTLGVPVAMDAVTDYILQLKGNESVQSVNAVVGETNDGWLNDIRGKHVTRQHVAEAIARAADGPVAEGNVGAGAGTVCFGFKGGIGTSSRKLPASMGGYTVGVLVQTNFGGVLAIDGVPVGEELKQFFMSNQLESGDGSCMIIVATDAPIDSRNLERLAKRAFMGLAGAAGIVANGGGDYVIAFSTKPFLRIRHHDETKSHTVTLLNNDTISPLFLPAIEATEEAIINSLFAAETVIGREKRTIKALPVDEVLQIMRKYNAIK
mgnify:CR=1 FL=1